MDYGHNPEAIKAVGRALQGVNKGRITAIIGAPGDREDDVIRQCGRAAAQYFDHLIVREDEDLRGRRSGETAKLLYRAAEEAVPGISCRIVADERDALELAVREMQAGEIVVVFYEKLARIAAVLERCAAVPVTAFQAEHKL